MRQAMSSATALPPGEHRSIGENAAGCLTSGKSLCLPEKYTLTTRSKKPRSSSLEVGVYARITSSPFSCSRTPRPLAYSCHTP